MREKIKRRKERRTKAKYSKSIPSDHADVERFICLCFWFSFGCLFYSGIRPVFIRLSCIYVSKCNYTRPRLRNLRRTSTSFTLNFCELATLQHMNQISTYQIHICLPVPLILYIPCISLILFLKFLAQLKFGILILTQRTKKNVFLFDALYENKMRMCRLYYLSFFTEYIYLFLSSLSLSMYAPLYYLDFTDIDEGFFLFGCDFLFILIRFGEYQISSPKHFLLLLFSLLLLLLLLLLHT